MPPIAASPNSTPTITVPPAYRVSSREIWALTWPQALTMFCQFLIGLTDVWVAGHIHRDVQAILGLVTQCQFVLLIVGVAIANGSVAAMSQSLGAGLTLRAQRYGGLVLKFGLLFSFVVLIAGIFLRHEILVLLQVPQEILPLAERFWLVFLAVLPSNYLMALTGAMYRARKSVIIPLCSSIMACGVNAVFSTGLGLGYWGLPKLGAEGIALSTFTAVSVAALFNLGMLLRQGFVSRTSFAPWKWQKKALPYLLKVATPAGGMQIFWQIGYVILIAVTASLPTDQINALAGMTVGMRVESVLFLPAFAFNMTGSMLVGHCLGAGNKAEAKRVGWRIILAGCGTMSLAALLLWPWIPELTAFIAPDPAAQVHAISYLRYNLLSTPFSVASMILGGIMTGAGATIYTFFVFSSATWLVRLPLAYLLGHILWKTSAGVFQAMFLSQVFQALVILYLFQTRDWARFAMTARRTSKTPSRLNPPDGDDKGATL